MMTKIIVKNEEKKRIDQYVSEKQDKSRVAIQRLIDEEKIKVNGKKTKASYKIQENDVITIEEEQAKEIELKAQDIPVEIIYEDQDIIVVNKPKGLVVHPANGNPDGTLVNALMAICKETLSGIGGEIRPGIVHRLDKDTSGILIVAKNDKAHIELSNQIKNHEVEKTYIAATISVPPELPFAEKAIPIPVPHKVAPKMHDKKTSSSKRTTPLVICGMIIRNKDNERTANTVFILNLKPNIFIDNSNNIEFTDV